MYLSVWRGLSKSFNCGIHVQLFIIPLIQISPFILFLYLDLGKQIRQSVKLRVYEMTRTHPPALLALLKESNLKLCKSTPLKSYLGLILRVNLVRIRSRFLNVFF
jgi:hypothetical protein